MSQPLLSPDDLPARHPNPQDFKLHRQLTDTLLQRFVDQCPPKLHSLIACCDWCLVNQNKGLTLHIQCPNPATNWLILQQITAIGQLLEQLSPTARICIYPPPETDAPFEIRVDELAIYQDELS